MMQSRELAARFEAYSDWRRRLSASISGLHEWISQQELGDAQTDLKVQRLLERLSATTPTTPPEPTPTTFPAASAMLYAVLRGSYAMLLNVATVMLFTCVAANFA